MKTMRLVLSVVACTLALSTSAAAEGPGKGELTKHNVKLGDCVADSLTVRWNLDSLLGEPLVNGTYRYETADVACELPPSTVVWLSVEHPSHSTVGGRGFVRLAPALPAGPGQWGFNVTGSPDWDEVLCGYRETEKTSDCLPEKDAKRLWKEGRIVDFDVAWGAYSVADRPAELRAVEDALGLSRDQRQRIQESLATEGFDPGPVDGAFGPRTRAAIRGWQAAKGTEATGYLTETLAWALQRGGAAAPEAEPEAEAVYSCTNRVKRSSEGLPSQACSESNGEAHAGCGNYSVSRSSCPLSSGEWEIVTSCFWAQVPQAPDGMWRRQVLYSNSGQALSRRVIVDRARDGCNRYDGEFSIHQNEAGASQSSDAGMGTESAGETRRKTAGEKYPECFSYVMENVGNEAVSRRIYGEVAINALVQEMLSECMAR